jgi:hypothetical protein
MLQAAERLVTDHVRRRLPQGWLSLVLLAAVALGAERTAADAPAAAAKPEAATQPAKLEAASIDTTQDDFASRAVRDIVYRNDLIGQKLVPVPRAELKAGSVYYRYHPGRGRHVWSLATDDGGFRYAMGPGSVQETRQFDLRASAEERQRQLQARAPGAARLLEIQGTVPSVRLSADDRWELTTDAAPGGPNGPSVTSVFDLDTGRRWEWHGSEPTGVIHSGGNHWTPGGRDYLPVAPLRPFVLPVSPAWCRCVTH